MNEWNPLWLTFKLASVTTVILFIVGMPLAYWLAFAKFRGKAFVEAIIAMPLVLPPVVLGFYLLVFFGSKSFIGQFLWELFGIRLVFTFEGLVVGSVVYSLPFMVHPLQAGFQSIPLALIEASYTLGKSRWQTLVKVMLPNMKPAIVTAVVLSFAHTVGEFGVVLMIGGNIPGVTRVAAIAIYDEVQALNYSKANFYALVLFVITFSILLLVYMANKRFLRTSGGIIGES